MGTRGVVVDCDVGFIVENTVSRVGSSKGNDDRVTEGLSPIGGSAK